MCKKHCLSSYFIILRSTSDYDGHIFKSSVGSSKNIGTTESSGVISIDSLGICFPYLFVTVN